MDLWAADPPGFQLALQQPLLAYLFAEFRLHVDRTAGSQHADAPATAHPEAPKKDIQVLAPAGLFHSGTCVDLGA